MERWYAWAEADSTLDNRDHVPELLDSYRWVRQNGDALGGHHEISLTVIDAFLTRNSNLWIGSREIARSIAAIVSRRARHLGGDASSRCKQFAPDRYTHEIERWNLQRPAQ